MGFPGVKRLAHDRWLEALGHDSLELAVVMLFKAADTTATQAHKMRIDNVADERNAEFGWINPHFTRIDSEIEVLVEEFDHRLLPSVELGLVGMEKEDVVHVADVMANLEGLLGVRVNAVEVDVGK